MVMFLAHELVTCTTAVTLPRQLLADPSTQTRKPNLIKSRSAWGVAASLMLSLSVGITAAPHAAAVSSEYDQATYSSDGPPAGYNTGAAGWWYFNGGNLGGPPVGVEYFHATGDTWWIGDNDKDGKSVALRWKNYRNGSLYRQGVCVNSSGFGKWGHCNKDYYEDSTLRVQACLYDSDTGKYSDCVEKLSLQIGADDGIQSYTTPQTVFTDL